MTCFSGGNGRGSRYKQTIRGGGLKKTDCQGKGGHQSSTEPKRVSGRIELWHN